MKAPKAADYDVRMVRREDVVILPWVTRDPMPDEDARLRESIDRLGIQEALNGVEHDGKIYLADGLRRMRESHAKNLPFILDAVPSGYTVEQYIRRIRFHLDQFRQNLLPTVRGQEVLEMKKSLGLTVKQVAKFINVDPDTVRYWTAILEYPSAIQKAIDAGGLSIRASHILFNGLTKDGQAELFRRHKSELIGGTMEEARTIRAMYPRDQFRAWYVEKEPKKPKKKPRVTYSTDEKKRLFASVSVQKSTLQMAERERDEIRARCKAVARLARATMRTPEVRAEVPEGMQEDLRRFVEVSALYG